MHTFIDNDRTFLADLQSFDGRRDERVGRDAYRDDYEIHGERDGLAFYGHRTATTGLIGFAEFHHLEDGFVDTSVLVGVVLDGVMEGQELDTFLLGMMHLFDTCRHLFFGAAVDDHRPLGTETLGGTDGIHGGVSTTDDRYVLSVEQRCVGRRVGSVHEVDTGQVFVAGEDAVEVLSGYIHESRQTCSGTNKDTLEALLLQFFDRDGLTDDGVCMELYTECTQAVDLFIDDRVRQTELRDAVFEYTADLMQRLEDVHFVTVFGGIACEGQAGRTTTYDGDFRRCICDL